MALTKPNHSQDIRDMDNQETDCTDKIACFELLQRIIDGQGTEEDEILFGKKIENCMPCFKIFQYEKGLKEAIISKISKKSVPSTLADNILIKIRETA